MAASTMPNASVGGKNASARSRASALGRRPSSSVRRATCRAKNVAIGASGRWRSSPSSTGGQGLLAEIMSGHTWVMCGMCDQCGAVERGTDQS